MADHEVSTSSTTEGLPVAPSLGPGLSTVPITRQLAGVDRRVLLLSAVSIGLAFAAALVAQGLTALIGFITNVAFYGRFSTAFVSPADHRLGYGVVLVPVAGALIVGLMARFGSQAIRGHGIPEAMEQILSNESRIPPRLTLLKPLSAAIAIGTGGPFGAEGPIIATGGSLGSLVGQLLRTSADERKTLLAAGAAAGMSATFGSPVSAVLLAIELLLFEYRPRSIIPVALATATAAGVRVAMVGSSPVFAVADLTQPGGKALAAYVVLGGVVGLASVLVTRAVYAIEDGFARLPVHWMWWPAIGALPVGIIGVFAPHTLGVGYDNIERIVGGTVTGNALLALCVLKFLSWAVSLGSGTSGGTLAPLFTIGGALGGLIGAAAIALLPSWGIDPRVAALVGMASMFAGASRALLTSVVFAFETTRQPLGLLPLLGGCTGAFLISSALMRQTIMTEKIARRGARVPSEYTADHLEQIPLRDIATRAVVVIPGDGTLDSCRTWLVSGAPGTAHQGFPVVDADNKVIGVTTRREILESNGPGHLRVRDFLRRAAITISENASVRDAADLMAATCVGRLPVVSAEQRLTGIVTRSDLIAAHRKRLAGASLAEPAIVLRMPRPFSPLAPPKRST